MGEKVPYGGKVLIINDAPNVSDRLAKWLTKKGYYYTWVDSIEDAKSLLKSVDFDIVVFAHEFFFAEKSR